MPAKLRSTPKRKGSKPSLADLADAGDADASVLAPKTTHMEFGGPPGALATMVFLPLVVCALVVGCDSTYCLGPQPASGLLPRLAEQLPRALSVEAVAIVLSWIGLQVVLQLVLPGPWVEGTKLRTGEKLPYKINGHLAFWISMLLMGHAWPTFRADGAFERFGPFPLSYAYDHFLELAVATALISVVLSVYVYARSFRPGTLLAEGGNTGIAVYDFFIGRELNPRLGSFDLKVFFELRPGLIGWLVLNVGMMMKQRELHGSISPSMLCVNAFQALYVWDALYYEKAILTTMDVTTDGFGFMLAFGDIGWVTFTYGLQARFLVEHDPGLSAPAILAIVALNALGYAIFRGANLQKDLFRSDPESERVKAIKWMPTERGTRLMISGWWGLARKINYTGDWLMSLAWCLTTGFVSPIPYFYCTYFAVLLVHRAVRDEHMCRAKYGADWDKYKKHVPYVFFPYII